VATPIPHQITTPDKVDAPIGTLEFFDGVPTTDTVRTVYDYVDRARAVEVFINMIPAVSTYHLRQGGRDIGATECNQIVIWDKLGESKSLVLTYNIYFAPEAPEGMGNNWIQTIPGKSWFILLRMYGPLQPWLDKTWRPGEIELVK
jgi:hypothetical protein